MREQRYGEGDGGWAGVGVGSPGEGEGGWVDVGVGSPGEGDGGWREVAPGVHVSTDGPQHWRWWAEAGVAASSGVDFDRARGNRTVRFSYCGPEADVAEAAQRLSRWR